MVAILQMDFMFFLLLCFIGCISLYGILRILIKLLLHYMNRSTLECPFAIKWEIDEHKLVALKYSNDGDLNSEIFDASNIPGVKYYLKICPDYDGEDGDGKTWIFLYVCIGKESKVKASFELSIESAGYNEMTNRVYDKTKGWGTTCCTTHDLYNDLRFIVNRKLTIKCEGTLCVKRMVESAKESNEKWQKESFFGNLWNGNAKDFTIVVDGKKIQVHKNVLTARSPVFDAMFSAKMKESIENQMEIIDFSYETVEAAIHLLYGRKISTLNMKEKMALLQFFDKYDITDLKDSLEGSLAEDISLSSVCEIATFSLLISSTNLQKRCHDYMVASIRMNRRTIADFEQLDKEFAHNVLKNHFHYISKN